MFDDSDARVALQSAIIMRQISEPTDTAEGDPGFAPIIMAHRPDEGTLFISPRVLYSDEEKHTVIGTCMGVARAWGADSFIFIADSLMLETEDPDSIHRPLSEDPKAVDCIIVSLFRRGQPDAGYVAKYHYEPEGLRFERPRELPTPSKANPPGTDQGAVPHLAHKSLALTEDEVELMFTMAGTTDMNEIFDEMREVGYSVTEG